MTPNVRTLNPKPTIAPGPLSTQSRHRESADRRLAPTCRRILITPDRGMAPNRRAISALSILSLTPACEMRPPVLPYIAVGTYSGECGYDWNRRAFSIDNPDRRIPWEGSRDVAMLIRFPPVDKSCVVRAYKLLVTDGFRRIYVTSTEQPRLDAYDPPLMP